MTIDRSMILENKSIADVLSRYFHVTDRLLDEAKQQGMALDFESQGTVQLRNIIDQLSHPSAKAEQVRLAYIELSKRIESELVRLHTQELYPDLYCGGASQFRLMEYISQLHKDVLYMQGDIVPKFSLTGTRHEWRDKGLLDFAKDQQAYLQSTKFEHLWDAVQCFEMQRYLLAQLFEYLSLTDNL